MPASRRARAKCVPTWRVPRLFVKSDRSCGCNQFPVGLAVKPTWAAHAGQIYYYAARERRRRTRARWNCRGEKLRGKKRERVATDPSGMRDAACDTGNSFTWRGVRALHSIQHANVKLNARGRSRGWALARAMHIAFLTIRAFRETSTKGLDGDQAKVES